MSEFTDELRVCVCEPFKLMIDVGGGRFENKLKHHEGCPALKLKRSKQVNEARR